MDVAGQDGGGERTAINTCAGLWVVRRLGNGSEAARRESVVLTLRPVPATNMCIEGSLASLLLASLNGDRDALHDLHIVQGRPSSHSSADSGSSSATTVMSRDSLVFSVCAIRRALSTVALCIIKGQVAAPCLNCSLTWRSTMQPLQR